MPHYNSFDSFKTKKSIDKKKRTKEKVFNSKKDTSKFIVDNKESNAVVIEVRYHDAYILLNEKIVQVELKHDLNLVCNQVLLPGDKVIVSNNVITNLIKRNTLLTRIKRDSTRHDDVGLAKNIAANIDLAVIVVSAKEPPLHPKFIDRYLMILENSGIDSIICLNKCDLKTDEEEKILEIYRHLGIKVIETSTYKNIGISALKECLLGKQAIFVGNSGVGKSSLTNALMDDVDIKTGHVGEKSKRGRHTTTTSKYYVWANSSSIIDTPGIRSLDISDFSASEIQDYFSEFSNWRNGCKYKNCLHYQEPIDDCMIKRACQSGLIDKSRYESYLRIISDICEKKDYQEILDKLILEDK